jgi:AcrR family transcriptional regulator
VPENGPRQQRSRRLPREVRERQILDAAVEVFSTHGYHAASMDEIAETAGVSKPMVYTYLGAKEDLFATSTGDRTGGGFKLKAGYLFPETHGFMEQLRRRLDLNVWAYRTRNDPFAYLKSHGEGDPTWRKDVDACCAANKNEPMERAMLELAVQPGATGPRARIMGWRVAGKTGTAHKQENGGYAPDKYLSSFVGLAPVSAPRLVVAVMIDEPSAGQHYGGTVAAPVFAQVMQGGLRLLGVAHDAPPHLPIPAPGEAEEAKEST